MLLQIDQELNRNSCYEASAVRPPEGPPLADSIQADVCVLGAGFAGLSAALELVERIVPLVPASSPPSP
ncbi:MAG: hypothetical protein RJA36_3019 [Pseudomonadota bacterium]|jgi:gamma-glutamylputrescine oxidase